MKLAEMYQKVFSMIEEFDENGDYYTSDEDFAQKVNPIINQISYELSRIKKICRRKEKDVTENQILDLEEIDDRIYQLNTIKGVYHEIIDETIIFKEDGKANIFYYVYPENIDEDTDEDEYEFELDKDVLECMAYGVVADILLSDPSNNYGNEYKQRYELLKSQLDPRKTYTNMHISGGIDI